MNKKEVEKLHTERINEILVKLKEEKENNPDIEQNLEKKLGYKLSGTEIFLINHIIILEIKIDKLYKILSG